MRQSHESYIETCRAEAVNLAKALLADTADFLESVRKLSSLRHELCENSNDEDFMLFLVIDSDTDHLPAGETRAFCSPEWLRKADAELQLVVSCHKAELVAACNRLIERFDIEA